jgi:uncharacterized membrane protein YhaH (DUF805 family)
MSARGTFALQTTAAVALALIVYIVVATIVAMAYFFFNVFMTTNSTGYIQVVASIVGSVAGIWAAKEVCDRVFRDYSRRAVFIVFAIITVAFLVLHAIRWAYFDWDDFIDIVRLLTSTIVAGVAFGAPSTDFSPNNT